MIKPGLTAMVAAVLLCLPIAGRASSSPAAVDDPAGTITAIGDRAGAVVGVRAEYLDSGRVVEVNAGTRFPMLSTFKVYAAAGILRAARAGRASLREPIEIDAADVVANSPVTGPRVGTSMSLAELCQAALDHSDNTAGNLLLHQLGGPGAIEQLARSLGDATSGLTRWETELNSAVPGDDRDTTTPRGLADGYRALLVGDGLNRSDRDTLVGWMRATATSAERMRAQLPPGWTTADKTGAGDYGTTNDAGLMFGPAGQRILLIVQTRDRLDRQDAPAFGGVVAEIARAVALAA